MKKLLSIVLCAILIFGLSSCDQASNESDTDDAYLEGLERGQKDTFLSLVNASRCQKILSYADVWETEDFSLSFTDSKVEATHSYDYDGYEHLLKCRLTLNDFTVEECYEEKNIYLGIYSRTWDGKWSEVASNYDHYFIYIDDLLNALENHTAEATFELYDNPRYVVTIIVIDGILYHATYHINEK